MLVPIACRFVPHDQWFLTHLDDDSKIKQVKLWFLSKCNLVPSPGPRTHRPTSPITFASSIRSRSSLDSLDDGYNEDDEYSDQDLLPPPHPASSTLVITPYLDAKPSPSAQPAQPGSISLVDQYTLISFSTGHMLEDDFTLSWYNLRPYELLEMHPVGVVAPLQRDVLAEYIQPYFQAKVRILRALWNYRSGRFEPPGIDTHGEYPGHKVKDKLTHKLDTFTPKSSTLQSEKRRKTKVDWKTRWVVINQGVLSLCKEHASSAPLHQFSLSAIRALRGVDALERAYSIVAQPRVVCINFRPRSTSMAGVASPPPSSRSSPISEDFRTNIQEPLPHADPTSDVKQTTEQDHLRGKSGEYAHDPNDGEWVVLDMLDDHAFSSILRILHREASHPISSSFMPPSSSIITLSNNSISSPVSTSFASYDTIPYPEWRINTVENARKAGMGDVGKPMAWVIWTEKGLGETLLGNIRHHRQAFSREMQYKTTSSFPQYGYGSDDESDEDSEMEWEGWIRDLKRQGQVRGQTEKTCQPVAPRHGCIPSSTSSPLPSPPLSETSPSGSPRVRSPSLSGPYSHAPYPNIGNVIHSGGSQAYYSLEPPCSPERIKSTTVSTVSVGAALTSRRRSSTLSAEPKRDHDKGKQERPSLPLSGSRASGGVRWSQKTPVRHAHSSSNLKALSYGSDAAESGGHAGTSSGPKRQGTFMRGVSLRAGKLVRGLESAIDFVDEKGV